MTTNPESLNTIARLMKAVLGDRLDTDLLNSVLGIQRPSWDLDGDELDENDTQMDRESMAELDAEIDAFQARVLGQMDNPDGFINDAIGLFIDRYCSRFTIGEIADDQENFLRGLNAALYASFVGVEVPEVTIENVSVQFASVEPVSFKSVRG